MYPQLVRDWMTPHPITIDPKTVLPDAHRLMQDSHIRRVLVVENGKLVGIVTLGDIREAEPSHATTLSIYELHYLLSKLTVEHIMTRNPITVQADTPMRDALRLLLSYKIKRLPVVDGQGRLVGLVGRTEILQALAREIPDA